MREKNSNDSLSNTSLKGLVLKNYSGFYYVQDEKKDIFECKPRGKLKQKILTGDKVIFTPLEMNTGSIERTLPRKNALYRPKVANVNLVLIVMACNKPKPSTMLLDRLLFLAEYNNLEPYIILNKCDLQADENASMIEEYYPGAGFNFLATSTKKGTGLDELKKIVKDEIAVFAGPSGAGKSSLLGKLRSDIDVKTQEVSKKIGRGKHTTRHVELFPLDFGGWIADTPGFSVLDMPDVKREEFIRYFPDFNPYTQYCKFSNCLHYKENECGVIDAVKNKAILESRYKNYVSMLEEVINNERCY